MINREQVFSDKQVLIMKKMFMKNQAKASLPQIGSLPTPVDKIKILSTSNYKIVNDETAHDRTNKYILFWGSFWGQNNWAIGGETTQAGNCIFTHNKKLLNNTHEYDALIFHVAEQWEKNGVPWDMPKTRSPHQLYIMYTHE
jgi:hypothetical protein